MNSATANVRSQNMKFARTARKFFKKKGGDASNETPKPKPKPASGGSEKPKPKPAVPKSAAKKAAAKRK